MVKIYIISFKKISEHFDTLTNLLSCDKKQEILRCKSRKAALDRLASNLMLLHLFGKDYDCLLQYGKQGKPYVPGGPAFNISHSGDYAVMAVSDQEIGIDIEKTISKRMVLSDSFLTKAELEWIEKEPIPNFFICWTRKESIAKLDGAGLQLGFKNFNTLPFSSEKIEIFGKNIYIKTFDYDEHIISVASETQFHDLEMKELNPCEFPDNSHYKNASDDEY